MLRHSGSVSSAPSLHDIARVLNLPDASVAKAVKMLIRLGFLTADNTRPSAYSLASDYQRFLEGLGFFFHTITLEGGERFGVP